MKMTLHTTTTHQLTTTKYRKSISTISLLLLTWFLSKVIPRYQINNAQPVLSLSFCGPFQYFSRLGFLNIQQTSTGINIINFLTRYSLSVNHWNSDTVSGACISTLFNSTICFWRQILFEADSNIRVVSN